MNSRESLNFKLALLRYNSHADQELGAGGDSRLGVVIQVLLPYSMDLPHRL